MIGEDLAVPDLLMASLGDGEVAVIGEVDDTRKLTAVRLIGAGVGTVKVWAGSTVLVDQSLPNGTERITIPKGKQPLMDDVSNSLTVRWP